MYKQNASYLVKHSDWVSKKCNLPKNCYKTMGPAEHRKRRQGTENNARDDKGVENTAREDNGTSIVQHNCVKHHKGLQFE